MPHKENVVFFFWFGFRVSWVATVTRQQQPSEAEQFLAEKGRMWGVFVPLHERLDGILLMMGQWLF